MTLVIASDGPVAFQGVVNFDEAGTGEGSMLYPAPNAAGFFAALVTHGLLTKSAKEKQKNTIQETANQVLSEYQLILNNFKYKELMERALIKLAPPSNFESIENITATNNKVVIQNAPSFLITQDEKAIIINNLFLVTFPGKSPSVTHKNTIRVISNSINTPESATFWTDNDGEKLKDLSAQLFAESISITLNDIFAKKSEESIPYKTVRYKEGSSEKIERAKVIKTSCDRMLIKNLRGILMSVPTSKVKEIDCDLTSEADV